MVSSFPIEFNDDGTWRPALIIDEHDPQNVFLTYLDTDDGTWHDASASMGEGPGQFRHKK